jgi:molybdate transport system substrate-binding protein
MRPLWRVLPAILLLLPLLSSCGAEADGGDTLTVFAAASLQEPFEQLGRAFDREHGVSVDFNFGPSSGLAEQIDAGAPADVFASASTTTMREVTKQSSLFAANTMQIAVPPDNPGDVQGLAELAWPQVKVAICQAQVPCGVAAAEVIAKSGIKLTPVTEESDVKAVLTKVVLGEVDAGIVYVTDVEAAGGDVKGIEIPAIHNARTDYPIAALTDGALARAWVDLVLSDEGQTVLREHGFSPPG